MLEPFKFVEGVSNINHLDVYALPTFILCPKPEDSAIAAHRMVELDDPNRGAVFLSQAHALNSLRAYVAYAVRGQTAPQNAGHIRLQQQLFTKVSDSPVTVQYHTY